jgi:cytochrome P450
VGHPDRADRDVEIGGYRVPKGVTIVVDVWAVHHDPRFYPDPEEFRPERWTEEFTKGLDKFAYIPFGVVAHRCIRALFAKAEAMLAIASIVQRFQIRAVSNAGVTPIAATIQRPGEGGVRVKVRARASRQGSTRPSRTQSGWYRAFVAA